MSHAVSPSTKRRYGVARVADEFEVARSTLYRARSQLELPLSLPKKRGPKTAYTDPDLVREIRSVLAESPFNGEGHRKVWARLRGKGIRTSKRRTLRLMRENGLLAPSSPTRVLGPRVHDGTIITEAPDQMWGTDATSIHTLEEGTVTVFAAVDHCTAECVGIHAAKRATRFEALEPIRQGVRERFGAYCKQVARGLVIRHDHGSQYISDAFQQELHFLGIASSPSFVRSPEGNGCIERFFRTLKEQLLWTRTFRNAEEVRLAVQRWAALYNERWLIERHGHRPPAAVRHEFLALAQAA